MIGRRVFSVVLAVLLCAAGLAAIAAVDLLPMVSTPMDIAIVSILLVTIGLPVYLIIRPPDFGDENDDDSGGGGKGPPPAPPEPPAPHDGMPDPDWSSFDDLRRDWEREPAHT